ncbi:MAG: hypothetical protein PF487_09120, partial [Bacteroidales bacterium]|nr:hypothetical protein [Bacteroidales bacterium]
ERWETLLLLKWNKKYISSIKSIIDFLQLKNYNSALTIANELMILEKNNADLFSLRAYILTKQKKYPQALIEINKAIEIHFNIDYLLKRARIYSKLGKAQLAINDYNKLIYIAPRNFKLYKYRASEFLENEETEKAKKDIDFVLKYLPNKKDIKFIEAQITFNDDDYISTLKNLNKLINKNTSNTRYFILRADTYMQTKLYKYASKDYSMALDINPKDADTYYKLAISQIKNNNKHKACINLKKAIRYGSKKAILLNIKHCSDI